MFSSFPISYTDFFISDLKKPFRLLKTRVLGVLGDSHSAFRAALVSNPLIHFRPTGVFAFYTWERNRAPVVSEITVSLVVLTVARGHEACNIRFSFARESMARFLGLLTSIVLVLSCFAAAQDHFAPDHSKVDIFGGYQFTHVALGHGFNGFNLNGSSVLQQVPWHERRFQRRLW